jgi:hypothetical protein
LRMMGGGNRNRGWWIVDGGWKIEDSEIERFNLLSSIFYPLSPTPHFPFSDVSHHTKI